MFWGLRLLTTHSLKRLYYSFTQEAFIGCLLGARTRLGTGDPAVRGADEVPVLGRSQIMHSRKNEQENSSDTGNEALEGSCAEGEREVRPLRR